MHINCHQMHILYLTICISLLKRKEILESMLYYLIKVKAKSVT